MPERPGLEPQYQGEGGRDLTRRGFLTTAAASAAGLIGYEITKKFGNPPKEEESNVTEDEESLVEEIPELPEKHNTPTLYKTGRLAGQKFSSLYTTYTGIKGIVPAEVQIDFEYRLQEMWKQKNRKARGGKVVVNTGRKLRIEYSKGKNLENFQEYLKSVEDVVNDLKNAIDYATLGKIKHLAKEERGLVEEISRSITGKDVMAYCLTELMPTDRGALNKEVMDFLLKNAGSKFIESIPALGDAKTSFGPYQFTEFALYNTKMEKRGASIVNQALPQNKRIPGSVAKLRGMAHHKAAYLFVVNNIADLVHSVSWEQFSKLDQRYKNKNDLIAFVATSHHAPGSARGFAKNWLSSKEYKPYSEFCKGHFVGYAKKTKSNLAALSAR